MNQYWIQRKNNPLCILFFNGWGMDEKATTHLFADNFDICMLNQYNPVAPLDICTKNYEKVYVVAWSLGVWAAAWVLSRSQLSIEKSIALNGTLTPIHDEEGIMPQVFASTLESWNANNRAKFNRRMFGGRVALEAFEQNMSARGVAEQKAELACLQSEITQSPDWGPCFDVAYIGNRDMIFTPQNQLNYWIGKSRIIKSGSAHYPFSNFESWNEIINL